MPLAVVTSATWPIPPSSMLAFTNASIHYAEHGEDGLREFVRAELHRSADRLREVVSRSVFLNAPDAKLTAAGEGSR